MSGVAEVMEKARAALAGAIGKCPPCDYCAPLRSALAAIDDYTPEPLPEVVREVAVTLRGMAAVWERAEEVGGMMDFNQGALRTLADRLESAVPAPPTAPVEREALAEELRRVWTETKGGLHWLAAADAALRLVGQAGPPPSAWDRETVGREVRREWIAWAREQPEPKPSWLLPWEQLSEPEREVDRRIGERIVRLAWADWNRVASPVQPPADPLAPPTAEALATAEAMLAHCALGELARVLDELQPPAEGPCARALRELVALRDRTWSIRAEEDEAELVEAWGAARSALAEQPEPQAAAVDAGAVREVARNLRGTAGHPWVEEILQEHLRHVFPVGWAASLADRLDAALGGVGEGKTTPASALATYDTVRAELVAQAGECCQGGDPLCSGPLGCLVQEALLRRRAALGGAGEGTPSVDVSALLPIAEAMRAPDDHCTAQPLFVVEQRARIYGIDTDYATSLCWLDEDGSEVEPLSPVGDGDGAGGARRVGYLDRWEHITTCFSRAGAEEFIRRERHNLRDPRVYVASGNRNAEWQTVRGFLLGLGGAPDDPDRAARIRAKLASAPRGVSPEPPPRVDEVYALGSAWLDSGESERAQADQRHRDLVELAAGSLAGRRAARDNSAVAECARDARAVLAAIKAAEKEGQ